VLPTSPFNRTESSQRSLPSLEVGDRITHDRFGLGRVVQIDSAEYICVDFGSQAIRRIPLASKALTKI
jgi:DNA helicase-2/ATP-dependent DNA helicase PcrA